jgi:mRNA interferase MazF
VPGRYVPDRGDVVWLQFTPQAGHEQAGHRPTLVISPLAYNRKVGLGLFCPITSQVKAYPFEVQLPPGLPVTGAILADQVKSLDWRVRKAKRVCKVPQEIVEEVLRKIYALVGGYEPSR